MEDIVASKVDIDAAINILKKYYAKNAFDQIRPAVRTYAEFASSTKATGWVAVAKIIRCSFATLFQKRRIVSNSVVNARNEKDIRKGVFFHFSLRKKDLNLCSLGCEPDGRITRRVRR